MQCAFGEDQFGQSFSFPAQHIRGIPLVGVVDAVDQSLTHEDKEPRLHDPHTMRVDGEGEGDCAVPHALRLDASSALVKIGHVKRRMRDNEGENNLRTNLITGRV